MPEEPRGKKSHPPRMGEFGGALCEARVEQMWTEDRLRCAGIAVQPKTEWQDASSMRGLDVSLSAHEATQNVRQAIVSLSLWSQNAARAVEARD